MVLINLIMNDSNQFKHEYMTDECIGIKALYDAREAEIMKIAGSDERWENWLQFTQSRLVPKFTEVRLDSFEYLH